MSHNHTFSEQDWPFDCPVETLVVTTKFVYDKSEPIVQVIHYEDGEWQFMCNTTDDPDDGIVVCMGCFFQKFPEVAQLADLPLGFDAYRDDINQPWDIEKLED
ncbi:hypothetical protein [Pseudoalteromonas ulvae]|mgnify:FL=1|uniref:Uncharacterized protein n=1 Tax=Pseudoalteromonas ulvae TaxID=107327 RepID=A0A244CLZ2_PSEDV|nr:hypothetical protein [Pseudoalteromonas ulvae]OUL56614.1 hypothetical protein B1199_18320 [Pseudoalteromonas ulvae]